MKTRFLLALFMLCWSGFAQDPVASLEGEVRDATGGAVIGASVTILNLDTGHKQSQTTSSEGLLQTLARAGGALSALR